MANNYDKLIKTAYQKVEYRQKEIEELKRCYDPVNGPMYFIENFIYIQHPMLGRQKIELYDFQKTLIHNYHNYRKSCSMLSRQSGKCLVDDTKVKIRNKDTGEIMDITFEEFENLINPNNM